VGFWHVANVGKGTLAGLQEAKLIIGAALNEEMFYLSVVLRLV
jgi:hypothetical protein